MAVRFILGKNRSTNGYVRKLIIANGLYKRLMSYRSMTHQLISYAIIRIVTYATVTVIFTYHVKVMLSYAMIANLNLLLELLQIR